VSSLLKDHHRGRFPHLAECENVRIQSGASFDADLTGVGASPYRGDMASLGVTVPPEATSGQDNRYLFRLAVVNIPGGSGIIIRGLMQFLTIRSLFTTSVVSGDETLIGPTIPFQSRPVADSWHLPFGDVSWHLRHKQTKTAARFVDPAQIAGTSPKVDGLDAALLYSQLLPYVTLRGGIPPGDAVNDLGTFYDIRFPWGSTDWGLSEVVTGPGQVVLYASVHQPNRDLWVVQNSDDEDVPITIPSNDGMRDEDKFFASFGPSNVVYGRIAGAIIYEPAPCCAEVQKGNL
jgi:hypothetical protein